MLTISRKHSLFPALNELYKQAWARFDLADHLDREAFELSDYEADELDKISADLYQEAQALCDLPGRATLFGRDRNGNIEVKDADPKLWAEAIAEAKALREQARQLTQAKQEHEFFNLQVRAKLA